MYIHTLSLGQPAGHTDERGAWVSAIFRAPVDGPVFLGEAGLAGDRVADPQASRFAGPGRLLPADRALRLLEQGVSGRCPWAGFGG